MEIKTERDQEPFDEGSYQPFVPDEPSIYLRPNRAHMLDTVEALLGVRLSLLSGRSLNLQLEVQEVVFSSFRNYATESFADVTGLIDIMKPLREGDSKESFFIAKQLLNYAEESSLPSELAHTYKALACARVAFDAGEQKTCAYYTDIALGIASVFEAGMRVVETAKTKHKATSIEQLRFPVDDVIAELSGVIESQIDSLTALQAKHEPRSKELDQICIELKGYCASLPQADKLQLIKSAYDALLTQLHFDNFDLTEPPICYRGAVFNPSADSESLKEIEQGIEQVLNDTSTPEKLFKAAKLLSNVIDCRFNGHFRSEFQTRNEIRGDINDDHQALADIRKQTEIYSGSVEFHCPYSTLLVHMVREHFWQARRNNLSHTRPDHEAEIYAFAAGQAIEEAERLLAH